MKAARKEKTEPLQQSNAGSGRNSETQPLNAASAPKLCHRESGTTTEFLHVHTRHSDSAHWARILHRRHPLSHDTPCPLTLEGSYTCVSPCKPGMRLVKPSHKAEKNNSQNCRTGNPIACSSKNPLSNLILVMYKDMKGLYLTRNPQLKKRFTPHKYTYPTTNKLFY
jgi:hypothetical protein